MINFILLENNDLLTIKFTKNKFDSNFSKFLKQYPEYASTVVRSGADALIQYKSVKQMTTRFFAKTALERKLYADMVKILTISGKFKLITKKIKDGGILYELVKTT